jgi:hypothetical protein
LRSRACLPGRNRTRTRACRDTHISTNVNTRMHASKQAHALLSPNNPPTPNPFARIPAPQASAAQRAGRAGRVRPGHCFRLCTEDAFASLLPEAGAPEMQRSDLSGMLLQLKARGAARPGAFWARGRVLGAFGRARLLRFDLCDVPRSARARARARTRARAHTHTHTHTRARARTHTHTHTQALGIDNVMRARTHTHAHSKHTHEKRCKHIQHRNAHTRTHTHKHTNTHP